MKTVAVIPTRYEPARLRKLLKVVVPDADRTLVMDNGHKEPLILPIGAERIDCAGLGLYRMWNEGWRLAREDGPVNVAILNDDIRILPGTLPLLARALRSDETIGAVYPDASTSLRRGLPKDISLTTDWDPAGGRNLTGFCFMFKGELPLPPFDEGMEWWYGDTEFDESVRLAGYGVSRVDRVPIQHKSDAETNDWARNPALKEAIERDGKRWAELHHEIRDGKWWPISEQVA